MKEGKNATREVPMGWFLQSAKWHSRSFVELIAVYFCLRLVGLVEPFIFMVIIDRVIPFEREASLLVIAAVFAVVTMFQAVFEILSDILLMYTANSITFDLGRRIATHLFDLRFAFFRRWAVGETISRLSETDTIRQFLIGTTTGTLLDVIFVFIYIGALFSLSVQLTVIVLVAMPFLFLAYSLFGYFLRHNLRLRFDARAFHNSRMVDCLSGVLAIKSMSGEQHAVDKLNKSLEASLNASFRVGLVHSFSDKVLLIITKCVTICIVYFGAQAVFAGEMTLGELIAFHLLSDKVMGPIQNFSGLWEAWQNARVSRQRLGDILNTETETTEVRHRLPQNLAGTLKFEDVAYAYEGNKPILKGFEFLSQAGEMTLVVGPSGIGKSTFARLAAGLELPDAGRITIDGYDLSKHDPKDVRSKIMYVPQDPYLFHGTLRDNLQLGSEGHSDTDIERALEDAGAGLLLSKLPRGLDSVIGEGSTMLSGGEKQRLALARALLRQPVLLILDEPTSALDEASRNVIVEHLGRVRGKMSIIVITHYPDQFPDADAVVDFATLVRMS